MMHCAILAQIFTLYSVTVKYSQTICAPIVLDAIFQQEPAKAKIDAIWDYVTNFQPAQSQLILSTIKINGRSFNGKVISFTKEKGATTARGLLKRKRKYKEIQRLTYKRDKRERSVKNNSNRCCFG